MSFLENISQARARPRQFSQGLTVPIVFGDSVPAAAGSVVFFAIRLDFIGDVAGWLISFGSSDSTLTVDNFEIRRGPTITPGVFGSFGSDPGGEAVEVLARAGSLVNNVPTFDLTAGVVPGSVKFWNGYFIFAKVRRLTLGPSATTVTGLVRVSRVQTSL